MKDRVAVVTGAGSGIGRATALLLAREGARVLAADLQVTSAAETAQQSDGTVIAAEVDVSDERSVEQLFECCEAGARGTEAARQHRRRRVDHDRARNVARRLGTSVCGQFAGDVPVLQARHPSDGGRRRRFDGHHRVDHGLVGLKNRAAYCASKGAVVALTRAMALDHVGDRVRVNCICPGTVDSPWVRRLLKDAGEPLDALVARQPLGRLGTPEEIAAAVLYVASDAAAFMTGSALVIDGGLTAG